MNLFKFVDSYKINLLKVYQLVSQMYWLLQEMDKFLDGDKVNIKILLIQQQLQLQLLIVNKKLFVFSLDCLNILRIDIISMLVGVIRKKILWKLCLILYIRCLMKQMCWLRVRCSDNNRLIIKILLFQLIKAKEKLKLILPNNLKKTFANIQSPW